MNRSHNRPIKITSVYSDDFNSLSPNDYSSLLISQYYSVVFCFPVSYRFTTEDSNLWKTYLQYRQNENFHRMMTVFTHADDLSVDRHTYIKNLPDIMQDLIKKCGGNIKFFGGCKHYEEDLVKELLKPFPHKEFTENLVMKVIFYMLPHIYFLFKI